MSAAILLVLTHGEKDNGAQLNELHVIPLHTDNDVQFESANGLVRVTSVRTDRVVVDIGVVPQRGDESETEGSATRLFIRLDNVHVEQLNCDVLAVQQGVSLEDDDLRDQSAVATFRDIDTRVALVRADDEVAPRTIDLCAEDAVVRAEFAHLIDSDDPEGDVTKKAHVETDTHNCLVSVWTDATGTRMRTSGAESALTDALRAQTMLLGSAKALQWFVNRNKEELHVAAEMHNWRNQNSLNMSLSGRLSAVDRIAVKVKGVHDDLLSGTYKVLCSRDIASAQLALANGASLVRRDVVAAAVTGEPLFPICLAVPYGIEPAELAPGLVRRLRAAAQSLFDRLVPRGAALDLRTLRASISTLGLDSFASYIRNVPALPQLWPIMAAVVFRRGASISVAGLHHLVGLFGIVFGDLCESLMNCARDNAQLATAPTDISLVIAGDPDFRGLFGQMSKIWLAEDDGTMACFWAQKRWLGKAREVNAKQDDAHGAAATDPEELVSLKDSSRKAMVDAMARLGLNDVEELAAVWTNDFEGVTSGGADDPIGASTNMCMDTILSSWSKSPLIAAIESRSATALERVVSTLPSWAVTSTSKAGDDEGEGEKDDEEGEDAAAEDDDEPFEIRGLEQLRFFVTGGEM